MIIVYINSKNKKTTKSFNNEKDFNAFIDKLDKRIEKGSCAGYIATK